MIGLHEPDEHQMQAVADVFGLHELAVEDAVHAHQRPKLERYDKTLFLVLKTVNYVEHVSMVNAREIVETGEIMIFVGPTSSSRFATVSTAVWPGAEAARRLTGDPEARPVRDHARDRRSCRGQLPGHHRSDRDRHRRDGRGHLLAGTQTNIECIYLLKREVVELRRAVAPLTLALQRMGTDHNDVISIEVRRYLRDVLDHNIQASDRIASYDELLSSLVQAALGKVAMQQNVDMRKISAWVAIAAVPTAIAGIYGMNFDHMPELHVAWGYPGPRADARGLHAAAPHLPPQPLALGGLRRPPCTGEAPWLRRKARLNASSDS